MSISHFSFSRTKDLCRILGRKIVDPEMVDDFEEMAFPRNNRTYAQMSS